MSAPPSLVSSALPYLASGALFGLSAGFAPGPLTTLVIRQTLRHRAMEGIKVALSPLITDAPIIAFIFLALSLVADIGWFIGAISLCGAAFLIYLGVESLRFRGAALNMDAAPPRSIRDGVLVNFLNPNPYLFWLTIGAPMLAEALSVNMAAAGAFIVAFYVLLVGSKMALAAAVGGSRFFLKSRAYIWINRILGLALLFYAATFIRIGFGRMGILFF